MVSGEAVECKQVEGDVKVLEFPAVAVHFPQGKTLPFPSQLTLWRQEKSDQK